MLMLRVIIALCFFRHFSEALLLDKVPDGSSVLLVFGESGSGKTTIINKLTKSKLETGIHLFGAKVTQTSYAVPYRRYSMQRPMYVVDVTGSYDFVGDADTFEDVATLVHEKNLRVSGVWYVFKPVRMGHEDVRCKGCDLQFLQKLFPGCVKENSEKFAVVLADHHHVVKQAQVQREQAQFSKFFSYKKEENMKVISTWPGNDKELRAALAQAFSNRKKTCPVTPINAEINNLISDMKQSNFFYTPKCARIEVGADESDEAPAKRQARGAEDENDEDVEEEEEVQRTKRKVNTETLVSRTAKATARAKKKERFEEQQEADDNGDEEEDEKPARRKRKVKPVPEHLSEDDQSFDRMTAEYVEEEAQPKRRQPRQPRESQESQPKKSTDSKTKSTKSIGVVGSMWKTAKAVVKDLTHRD